MIERLDFHHPAAYNHTMNTPLTDKIDCGTILNATGTDKYLLVADFKPEHIILFWCDKSGNRIEDTRPMSLRIRNEPTVADKLYSTYEQMEKNLSEGNLVVVA